jgi:DNA helicase II / ATP-dependent DNA helicase PcrA
VKTSDSKLDATPTWLAGVEGEHAALLINSARLFIQVVAGPGSGKTFGLERRIQRLVLGDGVDPELIYVGTFTRAIAKELSVSLASNRDNRRPKILTLHSLATELLKKHSEAVPGRRFRFLLEHEEAAMLYDLEALVPELNTHEKRKDELRKIQAMWANAQNLSDDRFRGALTRWLEDHGGMLIGEVVYLALGAMNQGAMPVGQFSHVVIDEYQDLTAAEQELVNSLRSDKGSLMVLGDNDQSIYGFRHNHPDGISGFAAKFAGPELEQLKIPENRRCGKVIVELANRMMAAAGPTKPPMISKRTETGEIHNLVWQSDSEEINGLARFINGTPDKKFLVLVPRKLFGYRLKDAIGQDASTFFHEEVLKEPLVRKRFALASLYADVDDNVAMRAWLSFHGSSDNFGDNRNAKAVASLAGSGLSGHALLKAIHDGGVVPRGEGQASVKKQAALLIETHAQLEGKSLSEIAAIIFDPTLADDIENETKRIYARNDLSLLRDAAEALLADEKDPNWGKIVDVLRYRISTRAPLLSDEPESRVTIMTLHGAKGLEADEIIVAGLADQVLPGPPEDTDAETRLKYDEQGRLLYVAVTRARNHLILSRPATMPLKVAYGIGVRVSGEKIRVRRDGGTLFLSPTRFLPKDLTALSGTQFLRIMNID